MSVLHNKTTYRWPDDANNPFVVNRLTPDDDGLPESVIQSVTDILATVRTEGDDALVRYSKQFDQYTLTTQELRVEPAAIEESAAKAPDELCRAIDQSIKNVRRFHKPQRPEGYTMNAPGGGCLEFRWTPVQSAALYVPGGRAAYPSTVVMNAVPALVAGVEQITVLTVPGMVESNPAVAYALKALELNNVYRIGGAHGIAAVGYGTQSINPVDVIVGPGNAYVAGAKRLLYGRIGIDSIAGPSEVLILADESANPQWVAQDLIAQAEHDPMARCVLASTSDTLLQEVLGALEQQIPREPRAEIITQAWNEHGLVLLAESRHDLVDLTNCMAPEHLQVMTDPPLDTDQLVAGAIFVGNHAPTALGDYIAGPNHVLPTGRTARFSGPLGVHTFMRPGSVVEATSATTQEVADEGALIADYEELAGHARALRLRIDEESP